MRTSLTLGLLLALVVPVAAYAQSAAWDGTWVGTTAKGGSVQITISGDQAQYNFRGEDVPVNQSQASGKSFQLDVGNAHGIVKLTMAGKKGAKYTYKGSDGGTASATLMRQ